MSKSTNISTGEQPVPQPVIEWIDGEGVKHMVGINGARETLARFYEEWPGGWSEFDAERKHTAQQPCSHCSPNNDPSASAVELAKMVMSDCGLASEHRHELIGRIAGRIRTFVEQSALQPHSAVPPSRLADTQQRVAYIEGWHAALDAHGIGVLK